jgi:hypothetical protein
MLSIPPVVRVGCDYAFMAINVREVERDQLWVMPPSVRDWLPEDHLAWFVLDVVAELDLAEFAPPTVPWPGRRGV